MKKYLILLVALGLLIGAVAPVSATNFTLTPGKWVVREEYMTAGAFFTGGGTGTGYWTYTGPGVLKVTDLYVATDRFNVYDNGVWVTAFADGTDWTDWNDIPVPLTDTDPPFTREPDVAWTRAAFAQGTYAFGPGDHAFSFQDIYIPPSDDVTYNEPTGTIAFQVAAVPLPSTLALFGPGLLGLLGWRRFRKG